MFNTKLCLASLGPILLVSGCVIGPNYRETSPVQLGVPDQYVLRSEAPAQDVARWWSVFNDPLLTELIERATVNNLDIAQSTERLVQARESLIQAGGARLPSVSASATGGRNLSSEAGGSGTYSAQLNASWSADLFGALARSLEASDAALTAAGFSLADVRRIIASQVASNFIAYRTTTARLAIARDTLRTQDENLEIAGFRAQAGLVSTLDVEQARSQRAQTATNIAPLEQSIVLARNQLSILLGQAPGSIDALLVNEAPIPFGPSTIAVGIPADTLRQRPDIRAAERSLAAATARIGVAQAQLYPELTLSGNVGTSALTLGSLTDVITGRLLASLTQAIFQGGQLQSRVRSQESAARAALAAYKSTVLNALQEVENGLVAVNTSNERARLFALAVEAANNAALLARSQYRSGLTDFRTLLSTEQALLTARDGLASAKSSQASSLIQLYVALGGGWDPNAPIIEARR